MGWKATYDCQHAWEIRGHLHLVGPRPNGYPPVAAIDGAIDLARADISVLRVTSVDLYRICN